MNLQEIKNEDGKSGSPVLPIGMKNYLIDIDGTVCEDIPNEEPDRFATAYELPGAREFVNGLYEAGHVVTFFTSRREEHRDATEEWLNTHGFKYKGIVFGKPRGGNYVWIDNADLQAIQYKGEFEGLI
ncbi:MAG: hypothetical protein RL687_5 [Candidatus Parcubacteria bacterium]|jgi:hypothetical protein